MLEKQDISDKKAEKATEEVSKNLVAMKEILYGTNEKEPQTEAVAQLAQELYNSGLLSTLVADLQLIDFEGKKDVAQIFNNILRRQIGTRTPTENKTIDFATAVQAPVINGNRAARTGYVRLVRLITDEPVPQQTSYTGKIELR